MSIDMWVAEDCVGGVSDSSIWVKYLTIGPLEEIEYPLTFWRSDELLLRESHPLKDRFQSLVSIVSYNLRTRKLTKLTSHGLDYTDYWGSYVKSLISVIGEDRLYWCPFC